MINLNYDLIKLKTYDVFKTCKLKSFPVNCFALLDEYKLKYKTYSSQSKKKREKCYIASDDAFTALGVVFYNDEMPEGRIRFSLMHELGHKVLNHKGERIERHEKEADFFASHILAPRMAIHYSKCKNHVNVAKQFDISLEAAQYAFDDYRRWHRKAVYKMNDFDKAMYTHFYNEKYNGFVYNIKTCKLCGKELLNHKSEYCDPCFNRLSFRNYNDRNLYAAENNWLYGGL